MRWLVRIALGLALLWVLAWFGAAIVLKRGADAAFGQMIAEGTLPRAPGREVSGFPVRLSLDLTGIEVSNPETGLGWRSPAASVAARMWRPWAIDLTLPTEQALILPQGEIPLTSSRLTADVAARPAMTLPLARAGLVAEGVALAGGDLGQVDALSLDLTGDTGAGATYSLTLQARGIGPGSAFVAALPQETGLPDKIASVALDAKVLLTDPLAANADTPPPQLIGIELAAFVLDWAPLKIRATGSLATVSDGTAAGRIDIVVEGWRNLVPVLVAAQLVKPELAPTVTRALEVMAEQGGSMEVLNLPLVMEDGWMRLGPLPLGPAPVFAQRQ